VKKEIQGKIVNDICSLQTEAVTLKQKGEDHEKSLNFVSSKFDEMRKEIEDLSSMNKNLQNNIAALTNQIDSNEQHNRNECLLMHGVPEGTKELQKKKKNLFVQNINEHLALDVVIEPNMIRRAHRLRK